MGVFFHTQELSFFLLVVGLSVLIVYSDQLRLGGIRFNERPSWPFTFSSLDLARIHSISSICTVVEELISQAKIAILGVCSSGDSIRDLGILLIRSVSVTKKTSRWIQTEN